MLLYKILAAIIIFAVIPYIIGNKFNVSEADDFCQKIVSGNILLWCLFQILCIPCAILDTSLNHLIVLWLFISGVMAIWALCTMIKAGNGKWNNCSRIRIYLEPVTVIVVLLIIFQCAMLFWGQHSDADDSEFVAISTTAVETNTLFRYDAYTGQVWENIAAKRLVAPFSLLIAAYSKLLATHPAIMSHTVLPVFLIVFAYLVYGMLARYLFPKSQKQQSMFLLFVQLLLMFGAYSTRAIGSMLLLRIWQGKAVFASVMLPLIFYQMLNILDAELHIGKWLFVSATVIAATLTTAMADILLPVFIGGFAMAQWMITKDIKEALKLFCTSWPCLVLGLISLVA